MLKSFQDYSSSLQVFWCLMYKAIQEDKKSKPWNHAFLPNQRLECGVCCDKIWSCSLNGARSSSSGGRRACGAIPLIFRLKIDWEGWCIRWEGWSFPFSQTSTASLWFIDSFYRIFSGHLLQTDLHWSLIRLATVQPWEQRGAPARFHPRPPKTGVQSHGTCQTRGIENTWKYMKIQSNASIQ